MATLKRVRCTWTGGGVTGPSVSTFYFTSTASGFPTNLQTFFQAVKAVLPDDVTITVPNTGDTLRDTDGVLQGVWTDSGGGTSTGTVTTSFARGSGIRIQWITTGIRNGRREIGSTFLVPTGGSMFGTDGFALAANLLTVQNAASALVTAVSPNLLIWGKPHKKVTADGTSVAVSAAVARAEATQLRSRRV